ncbi:MAG: PHP domain-containing protein [Longimicrobiales bacterium]
MRLDLHIHSTASDGSVAPADLVQNARAGGLDVMAITDHDTVAGVAAAVAAAGPDIRVIPAIEISSQLDGELHMLGYMLDMQNQALLDYTQAASIRRQERMRGMLDKLATRNIHISYDEVIASAGTRPDAVGRPHLARSLVDRGHARNVNDAFDRLIGDDSDAYVAVQMLSPVQAIELIHGAGGIAVWAHPRVDVFDREVRNLSKLGLDGVECYRPRHTSAEVQFFEAAAAELGLIRTGGSDWHGVWHGRLGDYGVDSALVPEFVKLL